MTLENKVAVVTGSDSGIGRAIATELAKQGASVTINYHKNADAADEVKASIEAAGGRAHVVQADVSSVGDLRRKTETVGDNRAQWCGCLSVQRIPAPRASWRRS